MQNISAESFWQFSLARYGREGVSALCLKLQDGWDADINLLLFCLWCASQGGQLEQKQVASLTRGTSEWRTNVLLPIRAVRRFTKLDHAGLDKNATGELYRAIKAVELQAEGIEQRALASIAPSVGIKFQGRVNREKANLLALHNLTSYAACFEQAGLPLPEDLMPELVRLTL